METEQEQAKAQQQETSQDSETRDETLKVYVRVRPRLKNEFLKETAAFCQPDVRRRGVDVVRGDR